MNIINAVLVKIEEERVVVIDGQEYLVMNQIEAEKPKKEAAKKTPKRYRHVGEVRAAVLAMLNETPQMINVDIRTKLKEQYKLTPPSSTLSTILTKMKKEDLLEKWGERNATRWSLKSPTFRDEVV